MTRYIILKTLLIQTGDNIDLSYKAFRFRDGSSGIELKHHVYDTIGDIKFEYNIIGDTEIQYRK